MSEDYKKIALEDVKKGQRVRIVERHPAYTVTCEGSVLGSSTEREEIVMGLAGDDYYCPIDPDSATDIFLLEDAPEPKIVRTETVTITHYDDGTKTETPVKGVRAPTVIETMDQFAEYEEYLKHTVLRDKDGDYWSHTSGSWQTKRTYGELWLDKGYYVIESCLPMTVVEILGNQQHPTTI